MVLWQSLHRQQNLPSLESQTSSSARQCGEKKEEQGWRGRRNGLKGRKGVEERHPSPEQGTDVKTSQVVLGLQLGFLLQRKQFSILSRWQRHWEFMVIVAPNHDTVANLTAS